MFLKPIHMTQTYIINKACVCPFWFLSMSAESHQVLAQLLDTLLIIGTQLPESPTVRQRLIEVACKVTHTHRCCVLTLFTF